MSLRQLRIRRKNNLNLLRESEKLESFDEFPVLRPEIDPQVHASRNTVDQPFLLTLGKDSVIAQLTGASRLEFADGPVRYFDLDPGDFVYVPGGTVHRILTTEPGVQIRYKARAPGNEALSWNCLACGVELDRFDVIEDGRPVQFAYDAATRRFNEDSDRRQCRNCGSEHPEIDLSPFRWAVVADHLVEPEED